MACGITARSVSGEGISWIEHGMRDYRATGSMLGVPYFLSLKAEALYLAHRTSEAPEAIMRQNCEVPATSSVAIV
jgi:hypothetical protein